MRRTVKSITMLLAVALLGAAGCGKEPVIPPPPTPNGETGEETVTLEEPEPCSNKIVAHRGGSSECGAPDNSIASLKYAMSLKLYGSECDIYWTKDNNVVVAHATSDYKINGLIPWEHSLKEIQAAGRLSNGEMIPSLEDYLKTVMVSGSCTRLWLDIKATSPADYAVKAVQRACEIIKEKKAQKFCEFICTSNATTARAAAACMTAYGIPVGWMSNSAPSNHIAAGFTWANLSAKSAMTPYGSHSIDEFTRAGMEISVFNVDKAGSSDGNAVTSDSDVDYYIKNYSSMKAICTNYPNWLKSKLK